MRREVGQLVEPFELVSLQRATVRIPRERTVHLQFRRYAGCPICNLHLKSFVRRRDELERAGVHEVVVFHSGEEELRAYQAELPFDVIADPAKALYRRFGVETSWWAVLDPRSWPAGVRGFFIKSSLTTDDPNGHLGLPADFLISPDGRLAACKYGAHADDQWTVDEVTALHAASGAARAA